MKIKKGSWMEIGGMFLPNVITDLCPSGDIQKDSNELIMKIAKKAGIPILLTLDSHFVMPEQKAVQDLVLQNGSEEEPGMRFSNSYHMMDTESAWEKWVSIHGTSPESTAAFEEGVENNTALADMCTAIEFTSEYRMPEVNIPREIIEISSSREDAMINYAYSLIEQYGRMPLDNVEYQKRLKMELDVITNNGTINFLPYFLTLHDVCVVARNLNIVAGAGRGSAGGCLLAYLLKITHKDPIKYGLSFERFLSQGRINRGKFPDIDMDFSNAELLSSALKDIYGDKIVRVCTLGTSKVKGAIRDVARVLLNTKTDKAMQKFIEDLCKTISDVPQGVEDLNKWLDGYDEETGRVMGELERNPSLRKFFLDSPEVEKMVRAVLGVPRSIGRHAAAYCIADAPVHQLMPTCKIKGETCTQFTMGPVEKLGLIKFDILGLNTLNDIGNCIRLIKDRHGVDIDLYNIPEDDDAVYKDFHAGRTETVFQFNGAIPTKVCKEIKPNSIMDLAAITAACRPGTLYAEIENPDGTKSTLIDLWKKRKAGKMPVEYLHPSLEPILSSTSGIFLFQEQINRMFVECCGYSPEMADEMREIIGKKKKDKMDEIIPDVKDRLRKNGWSKNQIEAIISLCVAASNYVFNVSHSVTYSSTGYACMYLKHYYPLEWWTAILQNSTHKDLEANAKYFKKYLQTPNVNVSDVDFYIIDDKKKKIVYPLSMIKGVKNAASEIVMHKPFSSMEDFYNRVNKTKVNKKVFLAMIWAGAFDDMPEAGSGKIWEMRNRLYKFYHTLRKEKIEPEELSKGEVLKLESLSLCIGEPDVYSLYKQRYPCSSIVDVSRVHTFPNEATVSTIGIISGKREIVTKRGDPMCFVDLSNSENKISVTFFPKLFAEDKDKIIEGQILRVSGIVSRYNDRVSVVANKTNYYDIKNL